MELVLLQHILVTLFSHTSIFAYFLQMPKPSWERLYNFPSVKKKNYVVGPALGRAQSNSGALILIATLKLDVGMCDPFCHWSFLRIVQLLL